MLDASPRRSFQERPARTSTARWRRTTPIDAAVSPRTTITCAEPSYPPAIHGDRRGCMNKAGKHLACLESAGRTVRRDAAGQGTSRLQRVGWEARVRSPVGGGPVLRVVGRHTDLHG